MQKWEYYQVQHRTLTQKQLDDLGADGWELVCVAALDVITYVFKCPY